MTRALLLERMVIDDWVRRGASSRVEKALVGLRWLAGPDGLGDLDPGLVTYFEFRARTLEELDRGRVTRGVVEAGGYDAAICLFALGAHGSDPVLLRLAKATLERFEDQPCLEERELLDRWIAYAGSGFKGPRPPLPFD